MSEIQQLINDIRGFMGGMNRCYQPRLKAMYEQYLAQCNELAGLLKRCRDMRDKGMGADARSFNLRHVPTLTERFSILNIPERKAFGELCEDYGMPHLVDWDEEIVDWLLSPVSTGDAKIAVLMQQWRRVARSGSNREKIQVLRQIVNSSGVNDTLWKKNLAEAEKDRYAEIEALLPELAGREDELAKLRDFAAEVYSPLLLTSPKESLLHALKEQMLPLQRAEHAKKLDDALQEMQAVYAKQDIEGLRRCCEKWKQLTSNPGQQPPTVEQEVVVADVKKYIAQHEENQENEGVFRQQVAELVALLEKDSTFEERNEKYEELLRTEHEMPVPLRNQMEALREEHEEQDRRVHVRKIVYGIAIALCVLIATGLGVALIQYRNAVHSASEELVRLKTEEKYEEGLQLIGELHQKSPRVSKAPAVEALRSEMEQGIVKRDNDIASARNEFAQLEASLQQMISSTELLETQEIDSLLDRGEVLLARLTDEQKARFIELKQRISKTRGEIRRRREEAFIKGVDELSAQMAENERGIVNDTHTVNLEGIRRQQQELQKKAEELLSESKVDAHLLNAKKKLLEAQFEKVNAAIGVEAQNQQFIAKLTKPKNADDYLAVLGTYMTMPDFLQQQYAAAFAKLPQWKIDLEDSRNVVNGYGGDMTQMDTIYQRYGERSLFVAEYGKIQRVKPQKSLNMYLSKNKGSFDINEVSLRQLGKGSVYFYLKGTPELEWDKQYCGMLRYMILMGDSDKGSRPSLMIFKYNGPKKTFTARTGRFKDTNFMVYGTWDEAQPLFRKCRMQSVLESLGDLTTREQQLDATKRLLAELPSSGSNPVQLNGLYLALLKNISEMDPFIQKDMNGIIQKLEGLSFASENWLEPRVLGQDEISAQDAIIAQVDVDKIRARIEFVKEFTAAIRAHELVPTGFLLVRGNNVQFVPFSKKIPREMLVIEKGELHRLFSKCDGGKIEPQDKALVVQGQLVWGYSDGQTSQEFMEHWRHRAEDSHQTLKASTVLCPKELEFNLN